MQNLFGTNGHEDSCPELVVRSSLELDSTNSLIIAKNVFHILVTRISFTAQTENLFNQENPALRNATGSLMAGVMSGYITHFVHNMSTLKLITPSKTYGQH